MSVVVVIGAGQIGQAIARRVAVGKHVVLADRSEANANAAADVMANAGLTGKITATRKLDRKTDSRSGFDRFSPENIAANMPIVDLLTRFAATKNATLAQLALAWLLA